MTKVFAVLVARGNGSNTRYPLLEERRELLVLLTLITTFMTRRASRRRLSGVGFTGKDEPIWSRAVAVPLVGGGPRPGPGQCQCRITAMPPSRLALSLHVGSCTYHGAILSVRFDFDNSNRFQHPSSSPHSQKSTSKFKASTRLLDDTHSNPRSIPPLSSAESNIDQIRCQNRWQELAQIPPVPIRFCCVAKFIGLRVSGTAESDTNNCTALLGVQIELPRLVLCLSSWSKFS